MAASHLRIKVKNVDNRRAAYYSKGIRPKAVRPAPRMVTAEFQTVIPSEADPLGLFLCAQRVRGGPAPVAPGPLTDKKSLRVKLR